MQKRKGSYRHRGYEICLTGSPDRSRKYYVHPVGVLRAIEDCPQFRTLPEAEKWIDEHAAYRPAWGTYNRD